MSDNLPELRPGATVVRPDGSEVERRPPVTAVPTPQPGPVAFPPINPADNQIIAFFGRKGSGKSQLAKELFRSWPGVDRLVLDSTGDADPGADLQPQILRSIPRPVNPEDEVGLPAPPRGPNGKPRPGVWWYIGNPMSTTFRDDLDRAVGMALFPRKRRALLWIDEARTVMPSNATGPAASTLLEQSRHFHTSALICCPRPVTVNPLLLAQADRVVVFDVPAKADRERLADTLGYPRPVMDEWCNIVARSPYSFLMYVAVDHAMYLCPPVAISGGTTGGQLSNSAGTLAA